MKRPASLRSRPRGFSLVELAVVLVITALTGALLWQVLPTWRPASDGDTVGRQQLLAEQALQGFVLGSHRLPCPDSSATGDGLEHCENDAAVGRLPVRTLGLPAALGALRYGVHRGNAGVGDLTVASQRYVPMLPPGSSSTVINGLDFCVGLQQALASGPGVRFSVAGTGAAFALAAPGNEDRDNDGDPFDGANNGTTFALPGAALDAGYDDRVLAAGFGELAARLGCMQRLGIANGGARAAYAAYDEDRFAKLYVDFRVLAVSVSKSNTEMAYAALQLAIADMVIGVATNALAIALSASSAGAAAVAVVMGIAAMALAVEALISGEAELAEAREDEIVAAEQFDAAVAFKARTQLLLDQARARALELDLAGLQP